MFNPAPIYNELRELHAKRGRSAGAEAWFWTKASIVAIAWIVSRCIFFVIFIYLYDKAAQDLWEFMLVFTKNIRNS